MSAVLDSLKLPIVLAPMAGGPSTPALALAVSHAGGLGFLAAGYLTPERLADDVATVRGTTVGVNLFVGGGSPADPALLTAYSAELASESERAGVALGTPRFDDDAFDGKVAVLVEDPVAVVSFTFGLPPAAALSRLRETGAELWMTVTSPQEARAAVALGADALVVQGVEAGGHRGVFVDDAAASELTLLAALQLIGAETEVPLVAAGAISTGRGLAAALAAGARAGQIGTAYLRAQEAGTSPAQRAATVTETRTVLTRAFSGRTARGLENRFHREHHAAAPGAYPEVHHLTSPLRANARAVGDADVINLWAGEAHALAPDGPAGEITRRLATDARAALAAATQRLG